MRAIAPLAAAVVMLTGLWACSEPAAEEELVVYTSRNDHLIKPVFDAYTDATGVKIRYITDNAAALTARHLGLLEHETSAIMRGEPAAEVVLPAAVIAADRDPTVEHDDSSLSISMEPA